MPNDRIGELFGRIRAGMRRRLTRGALLADAQMQMLQERLLGLKPRNLLKQPLAETRFVVIDTETTGFQAYAGDEICSISLIEMQGLVMTGKEFNSLVNPGRSIPATSTRIHQLTDDDVKDAPVIEELFIKIAAFIGESILVGHHVGFDIRFLNKTLQKELLCHLKHPWIDTMMLYLAVSGRVGHYTLEDVAGFCEVEILDRHTAHGDAMTTAHVFQRLTPRLIKPSCKVQKLINCQTEFGQF